MPARGDGAVDTVVFDVGGVLVEWDPRHLYRKLLPSEAEVERFLATVCTDEWNREQDRGRPFAEAVAALVAEHPAYAAEIAAYHERWDEMVPDAVHGTVEVLAELRERGVACYGLTNIAVESFARLRRRFGFLAWLDGVVVSGEERLVKPDRAIYERLCERFAVEPRRAVLIDDVPANTAAARELGFATVTFTSPGGLRAELARLGLLAGADGAR